MAIPATAIPAIVFGSVNTAVNLFKVSISAYEIYTTAKDLGKNSAIFQAQLLMQQKKLEQWGRSLGLTGDGAELDERLTTDSGLFQAVTAGLSSIKLLLLDAETLGKKYGLEFSPEGDSSHLLSELAATDLLQSEALARAHQDRINELNKTQRRIRILKKLIWAISDMHKFTLLVGQLKTFIDELYSLVEPSQAKMLAKAVVAELLSTTELAKVSIILEAANTSGADEVASSAALRYRALFVMQHLGTIRSMELPEQSKGLKLLDSAESGRRQIGTYLQSNSGEGESKELRVLIEWKTLRPDLSAKERELAGLRINYLSYFLRERKPGDLRALDCIGTTTSSALSSADQTAYGLVFDVTRRHYVLNELPTTLYDLLDEVSSFEFDLGDKFKVARMLAESVYELHLGNWLHKNICSDNVLFFSRTPRPRKVGGEVSVSSMVLSGYEFGRTGALRDPTEGAGASAHGNPYAHPRYRSRGIKYRRLFDIYSLGVVLLEIGLWQRVECGIGADDSPEQARDMLLDSCEKELGPSMGKIYRDVVKCCLEGAFPVHGLGVDDELEVKWENLDPKEVAAMEAKDERMNAELAASFHWKVVRELGRLVA